MAILICENRIRFTLRNMTMDVATRTNDGPQLVQYKKVLNNTPFQIFKKQEIYLIGLERKCVAINS